MYNRIFDTVTFLLRQLRDRNPVCESLSLHTATKNTAHWGNNIREKDKKKHLQFIGVLDMGFLLYDLCGHQNIIHNKNYQ